MRQLLWNSLFVLFAIPVWGQGSVADDKEDSLQAILDAIELDGLSDDMVGNVDGFDDMSYTAKLKCDSIITLAKALIGTKYQFGGSTPAGFDCSGLVQFVYGENGMMLPHSSGAMSMMGQEVKKEDLQPGDLLFFKGRSTKDPSVGHVGIVVAILNGTSVKMVHAATHGGVRTDYPFAQPYYTDRFIKAMRLVR